MSSYVSVEITCPHCDKTHRFTMVPEGATGKETGVEHSHQTRTPEEFAEKIREMKGKRDERGRRHPSAACGFEGQGKAGQAAPVRRHKRGASSAAGKGRERDEPCSRK